MRDIKEMIRRTMKDHPDLHYLGYGLIMSRRPGNVRMEPPTHKDRDDLTRAPDEVELALKWLSFAGKRKTLNTRNSSYGLKSLCERATGDGYLSNGAFICAALIAGFDFEVIEGGPNCYFNISQRFVSGQWDRAKTA